MGAIEPTAKPMEEAVKDSRHVMPMNPANLQPKGGGSAVSQSRGSKWPRKKKAQPKQKIQ